MTSTAHGAAAFGIATVDGEEAAAAAADAGAAAGGGSSAAAVAAPPAPAPLPPPPAHPRVAPKPKAPLVLVDQVLLDEVNATEETHPATRDSMMKLLIAVDKRDKFRFFTSPVTDQVVSWAGPSLVGCSPHQGLWFCGRMAVHWLLGCAVLCCLVADTV